MMMIFIRIWSGLHNHCLSWSDESMAHAQKQTDNFTCIHGMMKVALYDARKDSSTYGELNEFFVGGKNPLLISVPPLVYHGFKGVGTEIAYFISVPTLPYNYEEPDEFRLPPDTDEIPYDWLLEPGTSHG